MIINAKLASKLPRQLKYLRTTFIASLAAGMLVLSLSACGSSDPDCGSAATKELVVQISSENAQNKLRVYVLQNSNVAKENRAWFLANGTCFSPACDQKKSELNAKYLAAMKSFNETGGTYSLDVIRTTSKNESTKAVKCAATLQVEIPGWGGAKMDIAYQVEKTSDGKLYATVYGLQ